MHFHPADICCVLLSGGAPLRIFPRLRAEGFLCEQAHAFEARVYAESPERNFMPGVGTIQRWRTPPGSVTFTHLGDVRVDSGVQEGDQVLQHDTIHINLT